NVEPSLDSNAPGSAESFLYTATAGGAVSSLAVYLDSTNSASSVVAGLYTDANGHPGNLLTSGSISSPSAGAWNTVSVPVAQVSAGVRYWLALLAPAGGDTVSFRDVTSGGGPAENSLQPDLPAL